VLHAHRFTDSAPHPVTGHGIADAPGYDKPIAVVVQAVRHCTQRHERVPGRLARFTHVGEISGSPQPQHTLHQATRFRSHGARLVRTTRQTCTGVLAIPVNFLDVPHLDGQDVAPLQAAASQHLAAIRRTHAGSEAVYTLTPALLWLIRTLNHFGVPCSRYRSVAEGRFSGSGDHALARPGRLHWVPIHAVDGPRRSESNGNKRLRSI
jgi:hypothetical protein